MKREKRIKIKECGERRTSIFLWISISVVQTFCVISFLALVKEDKLSSAISHSRFILLNSEALHKHTTQHTTHKNEEKSGRIEREIRK
jgi:hypothetical protein